jgi:hypothetical protein
MKDLRESIAEAFAADTNFLAVAINGNKVHLLDADFLEDENLVLANVSLASFTGSTGLVATAGVQQAGVDPTTREQLVTLVEPAGGWRWENTADEVNPISIYGYALLDNAEAVLLAVKRFALPINIQFIGDEINIGAATFRFVLQPAA